jgi:hypothetical protein
VGRARADPAVADHGRLGGGRSRRAVLGRRDRRAGPGRLEDHQFNAVKDAPNSKQICDLTLPQDGGGPCQGLADAAHLRHTLAVAGYVAAGVAVAGALVLYLTTASSPTADHAMAAVCLPSEGGASCALAATF